jgi:hypothetical protein
MLERLCAVRLPSTTYTGLRHDPVSKARCNVTISRFIDMGTGIAVAALAITASAGVAAGDARSGLRRVARSGPRHDRRREDGPHAGASRREIFRRCVPTTRRAWGKPLAERRAGVQALLRTGNDGGTAAGHAGAARAPLTRCADLSAERRQCRGRDACELDSLGTYAQAPGGISFCDDGIPLFPITPFGPSDSMRSRSGIQGPASGT